MSKGYSSAASVTFDVYHLEETPTMEELLEGLKKRVQALEERKRSGNWNNKDIGGEFDVWATMEDEEED